MIKVDAYPHRRHHYESRGGEGRGAPAHKIEAAIVRITTLWKALGNATLVAEVLGQLSERFKRDMSMIKKRAESLIEERWYLGGEGEAVLLLYGESPLKRIRDKNITNDLP